jgi:hypothetical protein
VGMWRVRKLPGKQAQRALSAPSPPTRHAVVRPFKQISVGLGVALEGFQVVNVDGCTTRNQGGMGSVRKRAWYGSKRPGVPERTRKERWKAACRPYLAAGGAQSTRCSCT